MAERYTSIKTVLDKITRHPMLSSITLETAIDYATEFMGIVGVPEIFINKVVPLEVINYRAKLPCDYISLIQVKGKNGMYRHASGTFHLEHSDQGITTGGTYSIQGGYIFVSNTTEDLLISYEAIPVDSDGYPQIPDSETYIRALAAYIKKEYFTILFDMSRINQQVYNQAMQDYAFAVGACETDLHKLDLGKAESLANSIKSFFTKTNEFEQGFNTLGAKTHLIPQ